MPYGSVSTSTNFLAPKPKPAPPRPATGRIQYSRPLDQIDRVKAALGVSTFTAVGEETFDYFYRRAVGDDGTAGD